MIWQRVRTSMRHRPWNLDIMSGLTVLGFGVFVLLDPASLETRKAWDFLDPLNLWVLGWVLVGIGAAQFAAAFLNIFRLRWGMALIVAWHWGSFAFGMHANDPHAATIVLVMGAALSNALILIRLY